MRNIAQICSAIGTPYVKPKTQHSSISEGELTGQGQPSTPVTQGEAQDSPPTSAHLPLGLTAPVKVLKEEDRPSIKAPPKV